MVEKLESVSAVRERARASLAAPSRPYTPALPLSSAPRRRAPPPHQQHHLSAAASRRAPPHYRPASAAPRAPAAKPVLAPPKPRPSAQQLQLEVLPQRLRQHTPREPLPPPTRRGQAQVLELVAPAEANAAVEPAADSAWWSSRVEPALELLTSCAKAAALCAPLDALYAALTEQHDEDAAATASAVHSGLCGAAGRPRSTRLLAAAEALLDDHHREPAVALRLCRVILASAPPCAVEARALRTLCDLSEDEGNDAAILELRLVPHIVEALQAAKEVTSESVRLAAGCLNNLSASADHARAMAACGAVRVLLGVLRGRRTPHAPVCAHPLHHAAAYRPSSAADAARAPRDADLSPVDTVEDPPSAQLAPLVLATLRNLASLASIADELVRHGGVELLCGELGAPSADGKLVLGAARVLAALSLEPPVAARLVRASAEHSVKLSSALAVHVDDSAILIRVAFVLANVTEGSEEARLAVEPALPLLQQRFKAWVAEYADLVHAPRLEAIREPRAPSPLPGRAHSAWGLAELTESLLKLVRLLAHLAISQTLGPKMAAADASASHALLVEAALSASASDTVRGGPAELALATEELLLNAISAVTNLSFYREAGGGGAALLVSPPALTQSLVVALAHENSEVETEAARALGNVCRDPSICEASLAHQADEALLVLLEHIEPTVAYAACGALINIAEDAVCARALSQRQGASRLVSAALAQLIEAELAEDEEEAMHSDEVALLASKTLCNLFSHGSASVGGAPSELNELLVHIKRTRSGGEWASVSSTLQRHLRGDRVAAAQPRRPAGEL